MIARTTKSAILAVYQSLLKGSYNHMRAFYGQLSGLGIEYEPQGGGR